MVSVADVAYLPAPVRVTGIVSCALAFLDGSVLAPGLFYLVACDHGAEDDAQTSASQCSALGEFQYLAEREGSDEVEHFAHCASCVVRSVRDLHLLLLHIGDLAS